MPDKVAHSVRLIRRYKHINTKSGGVVLADTAAKEMQKVHQLCGGTIKTEEGERIVFDVSEGGVD
jgi:co-chaperonin GroES (HSP10)